MPSDPLRALVSYEFLLAAGITLALLGVVLRGFHQNNLRAAAARNQKARMNRLAGLAPEAEDVAPPAGWFVRHLPWCYRGAFLAGVVLMVVAFARR